MTYMNDNNEDWKKAASKEARQKKSQHKHNFRSTQIYQAYQSPEESAARAIVMCNLLGMDEKEIGEG